MSNTSRHLDAKVRDIINKYGRVQMLHPVVHEMYDDPKFERLFWDCMSQDLSVIRRRSQNLADGEITVIQKAFVALSDEQSKSFGAIDLYVNEIIGIEIVDETSRAQTLANTLENRDYIFNCKSDREFI